MTLSLKRVAPVAKLLPALLAPERLLAVDYCILRSRNSAHALRSEQRGGLLYAKLVRAAAGPQVHLHLRFEGRDHAFGPTGVVDLDLYLPVEELEKLKKLAEEAGAICQKYRKKEVLSRG